MNKQYKKLFDERFTLFWEKLNKRFVEKKKLREDTKEYYHKKMFEHFEILLKQKDVYLSLHYVFHIPVVIINFNERNQLTGSSGYLVKCFLEVIENYLEKEVSEYASCKYVLEKENLKYSLQDFIRMFRRWYQDIWNQDSYSQIADYLIIHKRNQKIKPQSKKPTSKQINRQ